MAANGNGDGEVNLSTHQATRYRNLNINQFGGIEEFHHVLAPIMRQDTTTSMARRLGPLSGRSFDEPTVERSVPKGTKPNVPKGWLNPN